MSVEGRKLRRKPKQALPRAMTPSSPALVRERPPLRWSVGVMNVRTSYDFIISRLLGGECYESLTLESLPRRGAAAKTRVMKTARATKNERSATSVARTAEGPERTTLQRLETFFLARRAEVRAEKLSDSA